MANQTRREDSQATRREELQETRREDLPATRHEQESSLPAATRHDAGPAETRREGSATGSLLRLPAALSDRYRIIQSISTRGGEADLLRVESVVDGQPAVIKLYRPGIEPKTAVLEKIQRCAQEHVIGLLEHGQSEGIWYEVLEYARHGSLRDYLKPGQPVADREMRVILTELHTAIEELHRNDIVHRDLKPENILIRTLEPLDLVLTDFGISSVMDATMHFTSANRTVRYAAPEAIAGAIGLMSDYWSLGMILAEALIGRHPFEGMSEQVINSHLITKSVPLSNVQEPWLTLCRGLLLRDPQKRWKADQIKRWLAGDKTLRVADDTVQTAEMRAAKPYRFHGQECWTAEDLAAQLAQHWADGIKDLGRGLLLPWFRDELRHQDLARLINDLADDTSLSADERLFRLLLAIQPQAPIYRGFSLHLEDLETIAKRANQGDEAALALVKELYKHPTLFASLATAGYNELGSLHTRWIDQKKSFEKGWDIVIAKGAPASARVPLDKVLSALLLFVLNENLAQPLRVELNQKSPDILACPWFMALGEPNTVSTAYVLVLLALVESARTALKEDEDAFRRACKADRSKTYQEYLDGATLRLHVQEAQQRLKELDDEAFASACRADNPATYQQYLDGDTLRHHLQEARSRLETAQDNAAFAQAQQTNTAEAWNDYLNLKINFFTIKSDIHVSQAKNNLSALDDESFKKALEINTHQAYRDYLNHPIFIRHQLEINRCLSKLGDEPTHLRGVLLKNQNNKLIRGQYLATRSQKLIEQDQQQATGFLFNRCIVFNLILGALIGSIFGILSLSVTSKLTNYAILVFTGIFALCGGLVAIFLVKKLKVILIFCLFGLAFSGIYLAFSSLTGWANAGNIISSFFYWIIAHCLSFLLIMFFSAIVCSIFGGFKDDNYYGIFALFASFISLSLLYLLVADSDFNLDSYIKKMAHFFSFLNCIIAGSVLGLLNLSKHQEKPIRAIDYELGPLPWFAAFMTEDAIKHRFSPYT
ncbi:MAG: protein kinase domain-containing protein [Candidatus Competibacteraceae bacterium]